MVGWQNVAADAIITAQPARLHQVVLLASAAGGDATIYEGQDASSGRKILTVKGAANASRPVRFRPPLECGRGIFVDVGSSVTEVFVQYEAL